MYNVKWTNEIPTSGRQGRVKERPTNARPGRANSAGDTAGRPAVGRTRARPATDTGAVTLEADLVAREPLSRERIIAAALELIESEGLGGLTMRVLGRRLGVEAMLLSLLPQQGCPARGHGHGGGGRQEVFGGFFAHGLTGMTPASHGRSRPSLPSSPAPTRRTSSCSSTHSRSTKRPGRSSSPAPRRSASRGHSSAPGWTRVCSGLVPVTGSSRWPTVSGRSCTVSPCCARRGCGSWRPTSTL